MKAAHSLLLALLLPASTAVCKQTGARPVITPAPEAPASAAPESAPGSDVTAFVPVDPNYVIGPQDSIKVDVWREPNYSESLLVRPDGMITIPVIGDLPAAGRTPTQLAAQITTQLKKLINDPLVTITVLGINSKHIYLVGEVGHIGPMTMTPDMSVFQAIASAGGLSAYANKKHIYILRKDHGKERKIPFDYNKALKTGDDQGITLQPGDTIVVP